MTTQYTADDIKNKLKTDDRWLLIGLLTIYKYQTQYEKSQGTTSESNDVGFNGPDSGPLSRIARQVLRATSEQAIRQQKTVHLRQYVDNWSADKIRHAMPKYSKQLWRIANNKQQPV